MVASCAFWGQNCVLQGPTNVYIFLCILKIEKIIIIKKNTTEMDASGAFWGPKFVLQGPTNVFIFFV